MTEPNEPDILVISTPIDRTRLTEIAASGFGDMVKAVVDTRLRELALGGDLHADEESALLERGSKQADLWGINIYPGKPTRSEWIEFDSLINIRPSQDNRSRYVENAATRQLIAGIVEALIL